MMRFYRANRDPVAVARVLVREIKARPELLRVPEHALLQVIEGIVDDRVTLVGEVMQGMLRGGLAQLARMQREIEAAQELEELQQRDDGRTLYRCAGTRCPGYPYRASQLSHPASCVGPEGV